MNIYSILSGNPVLINSTDITNTTTYSLKIYKTATYYKIFLDNITQATITSSEMDNFSNSEYLVFGDPCTDKNSANMKIDNIRFVW